MASNPKGRAKNGSKFPATTDKSASTSTKRSQPIKQETGSTRDIEGKLAKPKSGAGIGIFGSVVWRGVGSFQPLASPARNAFGSTGTLHRPGRPLTSTLKTTSLTSLANDRHPAKLKSSIAVGKSKVVAQLQQNTLSIGWRGVGSFQSLASPARNVFGSTGTLRRQGPGHQLTSTSKTTSLISLTNDRHPAKLNKSSNPVGKSKVVAQLQQNGLSLTPHTPPGMNRGPAKLNGKLSISSQAYAKLRIEVNLELLKLKQSILLKTAKQRRLAQSYKITAFSEPFLQTKLAKYLEIIGKPSSLYEWANNGDTALPARAGKALQNRIT